MVQEIIMAGFVLAHLLAAFLAYKLTSNGNILLWIMIALHLISIPLLFYLWELVSLISFPLIMVTLIIYIMEDKAEKKISK
jgi:uncharacterized membrane protein YhhN